jgi:hypothetical protein
MEETVMGENKRDILGLLEGEMAFLEQGGYRRSVRAPWMSTSTFQDSLTCINYSYPQEENQRVRAAGRESDDRSVTNTSRGAS